MELMAVIKGLEALDRPLRIRIVTDSEYVYFGISERLTRWREDGWRGAGGRLSNIALWQKLASLLEPHDVECEWVRGHSGHPQNELADQLAQQAAVEHEGQASP
jgi:ribonuclease HI